MRQLLWSTFLPWARIPGTPTFRPVPAPADLPGYRPYDAGHELPGTTVDDTRARRVCDRILAAEPDRTAVAAALLDHLGLPHDAEADHWRAIGSWFADRSPDDATPSLALDLGLLLGRRLIDARPGARWEADADTVTAHPRVVLGATVIALPLQAVEAHADLGDVLTTGLETPEPDPAEEFTSWLDQALDERDEPPSEAELRWMLEECGLDEIPEAARERLDAVADSSSGT